MATLLCPLRAMALMCWMRSLGQNFTLRVRLRMGIAVRSTARRVEASPLRSLAAPCYGQAHGYEQVGNAVRFLTLASILDVHARILAAYGGAEGAVRDFDALQSAMARPENYLRHEDPDASVYTLAALYGHGLSRSHAFADGNKRTAWLAMRIFLSFHDHKVSATVDEIRSVMLAVAKGAMPVPALADWLKAHVGKGGELQ